MTLFWIGIAVFGIGFILRLVLKFKYYNDYRANAHTDLQKEEMRTKYRPLIYLGTGIQIIGCIISLIGIWVEAG